MEENIKEPIVEETPAAEPTDELKKVIEDQFSRIRRQAMLLGMQVALHTVLDKITVAMKQPGKRSLNDYRRLVKDLEQFCVTGLSRKVNEDGETEPIESDENSTKLMEEIT